MLIAESHCERQWSKNALVNVHSHYDNLKVSRNATVEQIRSSYRALAARFHPDRNPGNHEAERIMKLINKAYEVLSDSSRRRGHDDWLRATEIETSSWVTTQSAGPIDAEDDNFVCGSFALDGEVDGQFARAQQTWAQRHF
jgi:DnaJ-class molecular chaperone